ncbi:MAG: PIN domain-containing protein [Methylacidiphilales bacterium]|nr:PIN domain-containing protein [Candidatus Methylacidiphilales bacterium]
MILVDSCVYIDCLREGRDVFEALRPWANRFDLATCGIVRCEVLGGVRRPKLRQKLSEYMDCMLYVPSMGRIWKRTETLAWELDRQGKSLPLTDLIIAVSAMETGAAVLSYDHHFNLIPGLKVFSSLELE